MIVRTSAQEITVRYPKTNLIVEISPSSLTRGTKVTRYESLDTRFLCCVDELPLQLKLGIHNDRDDGVRAFHEFLQLIMGGRGNFDRNDGGALGAKCFDVRFGNRRRSGRDHHVLRYRDEEIIIERNERVDIRRPWTRIDH